MEKRIADVSIVVANYNNGEYIPRFISSVIASTCHPKELIIVDDGSKDNSISQIESFFRECSFIRLVKLPVNVGFANALNEGIKIAAGKYIMRLDPDDYVSHKRIEEQYNFLESKSRVDIVGSNITYFDSVSGEMIFNSNVPLVYDKIVRTFKSGNCGIIHGTIMCKASVIKKMMYNQKSVPAEDYELFSLLLKNGCNAVNLGQSLTFVRIHINSVSNNLPFDTIRKTFDLRSKIWDINTDGLTIWRTYLYLYYYRKFLFCKGNRRYFYLFLSICFNPIKLFNRITSNAIR